MQSSDHEARRLARLLVGLVLSACTAASTEHGAGDQPSPDSDAAVGTLCDTTDCGEGFDCVEARGRAQCVARTDSPRSEDPAREETDAAIASSDAEVFEPMGPTYPADGFCGQSGPSWAFCEDFDGQGTNGRQDFIDTFGLQHNAHALAVPEHDCKSTLADTSVPQEYRNCRPYLKDGVLHTVGEHGGFGITSVRAEQPFDFTGREGHIHVESELFGAAGAHGRKHWGIALTPLATATMPDNRVVIEESFAPDTVMLVTAHGDGLQPFKVTQFRNGVSDTQYVGPGPQGIDGGINVIDIYVTRNSVRLVADGKAVFRTSVDDLGFERAYLYLVQLDYNPNKDGIIGAVENTFLWDNVAFDGPVLPRNALTPEGTRDVHFLAYSMQSCRVRGVSAAGPAKASWNMWQEWRVQVPANSAPVTQADIDCTQIEGSPHQDNRFLEIHSVERQ